MSILILQDDPKVDFLFQSLKSHLIQINSLETNYLKFQRQSINFYITFINLKIYSYIRKQYIL